MENLLPLIYVYSFNNSPLGCQPYFFLLLPFEHNCTCNLPLGFPPFALMPFDYFLDLNNSSASRLEFHLVV